MRKLDYSNKYKTPKKIVKLLNKYLDIRAKDSNDLGRTHLIKYKINFIYSFPIIARLKTFDPITQKKIKKEIQNLLKRGIIRENTSLYAASIAIVTKKDGSIRVCTTLIVLNKATIDDQHLLLNI